MLLRRVARPMLAAVFIQGGISNFRAPEAHVQAAKPVLDAVAPTVDKAADAAPINRRPDDEMLIKFEGGVKIAAGALLALGRYPRVAATALAATLVPTTLAGHRFWEEDDPQRKQEQQIHFMKNLSMFGGLLLAAADTEAKPSLGWRGRRAAKLAAGATAAKTGALSGAASEATERVTGTASDVTGRVTGAVHGAGERVAGAAHEARGRAADLAERAPGGPASARAHRTGAGRRSRAREIRADWSRRGVKAQRRSETRAAKLQHAAEQRRAQLQKGAAERGAQLRRGAERRRAELQKQLDRTAPLTSEAGKLGHDVAARASAVRSELAHQASGLAGDARKRAHAVTAPN